MKNTLISAVVAALVAVLLTFALVKSPAQQIVQQLGAVTGPDSFFPCETHNGAMECFARTAMLAATSTPCSFKSPSATSTLEFFTARLDVGTSTATTWHVASSTSPNATTSLAVAAIAVAAGARGNVFVNGPVSAYALANIAPNTYVNLGIAGGNGSQALATTNTGSCSIKFVVH